MIQFFLNRFLKNLCLSLFEGREVARLQSDCGVHKMTLIQTRLHRDYTNIDAGCSGKFSFYFIFFCFIKSSFRRGIPSHPIRSGICSLWIDLFLDHCVSSSSMQASWFTSTEPFYFKLNFVEVAVNQIICVSNVFLIKKLN